MSSLKGWPQRRLKKKTQWQVPTLVMTGATCFSITSRMRFRSATSSDDNKSSSWKKSDTVLHKWPDSVVSNTSNHEQKQTFYLLSLISQRKTGAGTSRVKVNTHLMLGILMPESPVEMQIAHPMQEGQFQELVHFSAELLHNLTSRVSVPSFKW